MADVVENSSTTVDNEAQNTQPSNIDNGSQTTGMTSPLDNKAPEAVAYDFKESVPEGFEFSQEESDRFTEVIKDFGLSNEQANAIAKYGFDWMQNMGQQMQEMIPQHMQTQADGWAEETRKAYGSDYDKALANAGQAIEYLKRNGVPDIQNLFATTGAGSRVEMFQLLNVVSRMIESDPGKAAVGTPSAQSSLDKFYNNSDFNKL